MLFREAVSVRILEICEENNISPNRLAEKSTIPPSTLRDVVACKVINPSSFVIYQLCKAVKLPINEFYKSELFNFDKLDD